MRRISFSHTMDQFLDGSKTVTRRTGWKKLKAGMRLVAVEKAMGLKKGEKHNILGRILVTSVRREQLRKITDEDVAREGFPDMTREEFIAMFCKAFRCKRTAYVTRIEFEKIQ